MQRMSNNNDKLPDYLSDLLANLSVKEKAALVNAANVLHKTQYKDMDFKTFLTRYKTAWICYLNDKHPTVAIPSHLQGINFKENVKVMELTADVGDLIQYQAYIGGPNRQGQYYAFPGTQPTQLGISPQASFAVNGVVHQNIDKVAHVYKIKEPVYGLVTTAAAIKDTWSHKKAAATATTGAKYYKPPTLEKGGGKQIYCAQSAKFEFQRRLAPGDYHTPPAPPSTPRTVPQKTIGPTSTK